MDVLGLLQGTFSPTIYQSKQSYIRLQLIRFFLRSDLSIYWSANSLSTFFTYFYYCIFYYFYSLGLLVFFSPAFTPLLFLLLPSSFYLTFFFVCIFLAGPQSSQDKLQSFFYLFATGSLLWVSFCSYACFDSLFTFLLFQEELDEDYEDVDESFSFFFLPFLSLPLALEEEELEDE